MLIVKEDKLYTDEQIKRGDLITETTWLESEGQEFYIPNLFPVLGDKQALQVEDLFVKVFIVGLAKHIKASKKPNSDVYIDRKKQKILFFASRDIKKDEEITYTLHQSCFNDVKIQ